MVDASALLEGQLRTPVAEAVERRLFASRETLHAPHLIDVDVVEVVRRYAAVGEIELERGVATLADLADMPSRRYSHDLLLPRVWALRHNLTLLWRCVCRRSPRHSAPLLTRDQRMAAAAGHHARIELV